MLRRKDTNENIKRKLTNEFVNQHRLTLDVDDRLSLEQPKYNSNGQTAWDITANELALDKYVADQITKQLDASRIRDRFLIASPASNSGSQHVSFINTQNVLQLRSTISMYSKNIDRAIENGNKLQQENKSLKDKLSQIKQHNNELVRQLQRCNYELHSQKSESNQCTVVKMDSTDNYVEFTQPQANNKAKQIEQKLRAKYFKQQQIKRFEQQLIDNYFKCSEPHKRSRSVIVMRDEEHYNTIRFNTMQFADIIVQYVEPDSTLLKVHKDRSGRLGNTINIDDLKRIINEELG